LVTAVRDGRALVTVRDGDRRAATMVEVEGAASPYPLTFRNHVMPVLTRVGCNSGPCHGALAGKSGLKLTLRGYDPEADYLTLTRQATARRSRGLRQCTAREFHRRRDPAEAARAQHRAVRVVVGRGIHPARLSRRRRDPAGACRGERVRRRCPSRQARAPGGCAARTAG